jgi:hypothetical protein
VIVELTGRANPALEQLLVAHLEEMDDALAQTAMQQAMAAQPPPKPECRQWRTGGAERRR